MIRRRVNPNEVSTLIYNVEEEPIFLSKSLIDLFLKSGNFANLIALYAFYYYTAKWQGTNQPKATVSYVAKGIGWGEDKVHAVRKTLINYGLIEDITQRDTNGRLIGHYVKLNFTFTSVGVLPPQVKSGINALKPNKRKILRENFVIPPSKELVQTYCSQRNNGIDAQAFIDFYTSKGWMIGKNRMKDWQAAVRTWEKGEREKNTKFKPKFIHDDGIKYVLQEDGYYHHCRSGAIYIP